jgi:Na+-translocating ferredoxin:NAD+ oxidoreductase subunit C
LEFQQKTLVPNKTNTVITDEQLVKQQVRIKQAELKLAEAEKKLAECMAGMAEAAASPVQAAPVQAAPAVDVNDPVAAAIARAQAKLTMSPEDKARANLESLRSRFAKAQEKAAAAKTEGSTNADALQQGADKLQQKITEALAELTALGLSEEPLAPLTTTPAAPVTPEPAISSEQNAAQAAIEKAKAKAAAMATMSDEEKRTEQRQSLQTRLLKARERLAKAEAENDANIEAFRTGVTKLEEKLNELA